MGPSGLAGRGVWISFLVLLAMGPASQGVARAQPSPHGPEFQVNSYTTSGQWRSAVAMDSLGNFVVVWDSLGSSAGDTDQLSVQARRYDTNGNAVGSQFQVNTYTTDQQYHAAVAMDPAGNFIVVWESRGAPSGGGSDTSSASIQGRRYDTNGDAVGSQFQVNTYTTSGQWSPSVAIDDQGEFVVVWKSYQDGDYPDVFAQRYDSDGNRAGSEFQVNTYTTDQQAYPSVAMDSQGNFVVVWTSYGSDGDDTSYRSIQGQRYDSIGDPVGSEFQVNTYTTDDQFVPAVAMDDQGGFVVVWEGRSSGSDTDWRSIQGQRFDSNGDRAGSELQINTYTSSYQREPAVAADPQGNFVVVWRSEGSSGGDTSFYSIQGQRYAANGDPLGSEFQVNAFTTGRQDRPAVAMDPNGNIIVAWDSYGSPGSDQDWTSIQGRLYDALFRDGFEIDGLSRWSASQE